MSKTLLSLAIAAMAFSSCSKDKNTATVDVGTVRYINNSPGGYRYEMFLDGNSLGLLAAGNTSDKSNIPTGTHSVQAKQYEGYVISPSVYSQNVNVTKGATLQFSFP